MNTLQTSEAGQRTVHPDLFALCLDHLESEQATLGVILAGLRETETALLGQDRGALTESLRAQTRLAEIVAAIRRCRVEVRRQLASAFHCAPAAATLDVLARSLASESSARLSRERCRVRELALEVHRLNGKLAGLVFHCLDFLTAFVAELTGADRHCLYGPAGRREEPVGRPVLQARV